MTPRFGFRSAAFPANKRQADSFFGNGPLKRGLTSRLQPASNITIAATKTISRGYCWDIQFAPPIEALETFGISIAASAGSSQAWLFKSELMFLNPPAAS